MGFASKDILANLDKKYSSRNPQYLMDGKRMIDEAVAKAEVDGAFLEEYFKLKKKVELDNQVLVIAVAIFTGLAVSFSFDLLGSPATPLNIVVQITSFLVVLSAGLWSCCTLVQRWAFTKEQFLKSYLLHRMEEKLDEDAHLHTDDKDS